MVTKKRSSRFPRKHFDSAWLFLGAAIGLVVANYSTTTDAPEAPVTGMALDDFIRLNTTSYKGLAPAATAAVVESLPVDPGFFDMNVGSFDGLAPAASATAADPRFVDINTTALGWLSPAATATVAEYWVVDPGFLEMNIGLLEYPVTGYTEPLGGIR